MLSSFDLMPTSLVTKRKTRSSLSPNLFFIPTVWPMFLVLPPQLASCTASKLPRFILFLCALLIVVDLIGKLNSFLFFFFCYFFCFSLCLSLCFCLFLFLLLLFLFLLFLPIPFPSSLLCCTLSPSVLGALSSLP